MKYSEKQPPPVALTEWLALAKADWTPTYANLAGSPREETRDSLLREQGFVCAYCGQGLKGDRSDSHIDHFWPQQYFNPQSMPDRPDRTLDYENFFASCGPPGLPTAVGRIPSTCGDHKGNWFDPTNYIMPSHVGCEQRFSYGANGQIMPASPTDAAAANMISVLNLNEPALQYQRQQIIIGIEQAIAAGDFTLATRDDEIAAWRRPNDGKLKSFGHVAARYLESEPL